VTYAFFDPVARRYQTVKSDPLTIHVRSSALAAEEREATAAALRAVRASPERASLRWVRSKGFLAAQLLPLLLIASALALTIFRRTRPPGPDLLAALKRIRQSQSEYQEFLRDLEALLRTAANTSAMAAALKPRLDALIERIEAQRFAPSAAQSAERESLANEAEAILRELKRTRRPETRSALLLVFMLLQPPSAGEFARGVELYRQGHFAQSADAFEAALARDSTDVAAWANLGNAYFRAGDRGRAIWAWAHATREAPRDGAIVRNLRTAGAVEVLRTRPPLSVRPEEWYLLAALAWWLAGIIAVVAIVRRHWQLLSWALPPVTLAAIAMAVGIIADGQRYVVALNDETRMYGDPTIHSPIVRRVQAGAGLDVLEERGDWLRVQTISEAEGWVEADAVGKL
jgi:tetratricopeptide (TPR) repeat protein